jgi:hypothetical protein
MSASNFEIEIAEESPHETVPAPVAQAMAANAETKSNRSINVRVAIDRLQCGYINAATTDARPEKLLEPTTEDDDYAINK